MKKRGMTALACTAMLAAALTGCGNMAEWDGVNRNGTYAPDAQNGIVTDTDGMIGDVNNSNGIVDRPVTDSTKTDRNNNMMDRAGNAVKNGMDRVGNALEDGVNDLTDSRMTTGR